MGVTLTRAEGGCELVLQGVVDIFDARELHRMALDAAQAPAGVIVRLGETSRIDTAVSQILVALKRALAGEGKRFTLDAPSAGVKESWRLLGLEDELTSS
jgi:anti-anti-sigma regulatory factor